MQIKTIGDQPDAARQRADYKELTTTPFPKDNLISVFDLAQRSVRMYRDRPCLGTRSYLGTQKADPKKGQRFDPELFAPEVQWVTYGEFGDRLQAFGAGLKKLGMVSQPDNVDKFEEVAVACSAHCFRALHTRARRWQRAHCRWCGCLATQPVAALSPVHRRFSQGHPVLPLRAESACAWPCSAERQGHVCARSGCVRAGGCQRQGQGKGSPRGSPAASCHAAICCTACWALWLLLLRLLLLRVLLLAVADAFTRVLARLQVADKKVPCSLTIYENTCASWQTAAHACFSQSMVALSPCVHALCAPRRQCHMPHVVCGQGHACMQ